MSSSDKNIARSTTRAFANIMHPAVRAFAFEQVGQAAEARAFAIAMLTGNFEAGDHEKALRWFLNEQDRHGKHDMSIDPRQLLERAS
jgi:hypothetical protein